MGKGKYCSVQCYGIVNRIKSISPNSEIRNCFTCNKEFRVSPSIIRKGKGKFCSLKCAGIANSIRQKGRKLPKSQILNCSCKMCNKKFHKNKAQIRNGEGKFCSRSCRNKWESIYRIGENSVNWQGGLSFEPYSQEFNNILKTKIKERDNYICQLCNTKTYKHLNIHHIDYDKKNNDEENLISLCIPCHLKTNINRIFWTGFLIGMKNVLLNNKYKGV